MKRSGLILVSIIMAYGNSLSAMADMWTTPQLFAPANVPNAQDWRVVFAPDNLSFYLMSERNGHFADTEVYRSTRPNAAAAWGSPTAVAELNTGNQDFLYWVSPDQTEAFMARHGNPTPNTFGDIYRTTRPSAVSPWNAAIPVNELNNANTFEWEIHLTANGLNAVFSTGRSGGSGGLDLWQTTRAGIGLAWTPPVPINEINSASDERGPCLSADGLTLFFTRQGLGMFQSTRTSLLTPFSSPVALGFGNDVHGPTLSPDGQTLYFSKPNGSDFNHDVYFSTFVPEPTSLTLLAISAGGLLQRRRRA